MSEPAALDLAAITAIHRRRESVGFESPDWCDECCTDWPCVYAAAVDELTSCRAERDALRAAILDIDAHATPLGEDDDGFVAVGYAVSVGAMHRALGLARQAALGEVTQ